ncbi:energy-coupling factor ABC transporter ATP-binding protein [Ammoniphilus sp. YIM 78166]|uniref:energy-coupling factor ABC transporter ATP-binding protein n=1 Tax=Ammoniphilus sp. YIM 78166 TaxID=1644106 RepID=UPI00106F4040|nr:ATP-binding cassette domain-containing protein [Ammoniphilus sp. YIM 78166]
MIEFRKVTYKYKGERPALEDVSLSISEKKKTAIVGANGAGKSTLLLHMNGLFLASSGEVRYCGQSITKKNRDEMTERVGIVFQDPDDQIVSLTVRDDIAFGLAQKDMSREELERRTDYYLTLLNLSHLAECNPSELSYGQKKMVAIAGVLTLETDVVIFDEPMAFLDPVGKREIQGVMELLANRGKTVVVATHDMQLVAEWADEVVVMKAGSCLGTYSPHRLFSNHELIKEANLQRPIAAQLLEEVWDGPPSEIPIRLEEAQKWLKQKLG